jgi:hypothetical protein
LKEGGKHMGAGMTNDPLDGHPERPRERINLLLALVSEDWKRSGADQRFFQYFANLAQDLIGAKDTFMVEDDTVIEALRARTDQRS